MSNVVLSGAGGGKPYQIENSLMFDDGDDAYFNQTLVAGTDDKKWTFSAWVKVSNPTSMPLLVSNVDGDDAVIEIQNTGELMFRNHTTGAGTYTVYVYTNTKLFDVAAFQHVMVVYDSANATEADRCILYVNGVRQTVTILAAIALNETTYMNQNYAHYLNAYANSQTINGSYYMAECAFIDGQALGPESFGEFRSDSPSIWRPIGISGLSFSGTNSFWLDFKDATSATTLGYDVSGNTNHWTPNNLATSDQRTDTPTNNSATLNAIDPKNSGEIRQGNLELYTVALSSNSAYSTGLPSSGKWYTEINVVEEGANYSMLGISNRLGESIYYRSSDGYKGIDGSYTAYGATWTDGAVIGIAFDFDTATNNITFYKNNVSQGTISYDLQDGTDWVVGSYVLDSGGLVGIHVSAFHEDDLNYTPPSGYLPLMNKYLPTPAIYDPRGAFDPVLYTGNATAARVIPTQTRAKLIIIKNRDQADEWKIIDSVRGATQELNWDSQNQQSTDGNGVTAIDAVSGFTLGTGAGGYNDNNEDFVAYTFRTHPTTGMDIVQYTGNGTAGNTVAHNLGVKPEFMYVKNLALNTSSWVVYFESIGATEYLALDTNAAKAAAVSWNDTEPTSTIVTLGGSTWSNGNGQSHILHLFASVEGFSKVFSYTGNGLVDGNFIHCGFKPSFVLIKCTNEPYNWFVEDSVINPYNPADTYLHADLPNAETTSAEESLIDFVSNGFKFRENGWGVNQVDKSYVGIAFAEYPYALLNNSEF